MFLIKCLVASRKTLKKTNKDYSKIDHEFFPSVVNNYGLPYFQI